MEIMDMDSKQKIRYFSESSNASTSGYSTMSPGGGTATLGVDGMSPLSSNFSSPSQSPGTAMQMEFSNLNLPAGSSQFYQQHQQAPHYAQLQGNTQTLGIPMYNNISAHNFGIGMHPSAMVSVPQQQLASFQPTLKKEFTAELRILTHPAEKFRFRYKSEMHGTHGSLNGANSNRTSKTFPEVELRNFNGSAVIRCSLFQTNLESPHSHQLVVRRDERDICDPHDLHVSTQLGYVAQFQNMGIIHTAKKFIFNELLKKKENRLRFELGREELSVRQTQELHKETEKEAKDMNLNQVRLCFEAFKVEDNNTWTRIAAPVYTNPVNNRKSAQTGELRICRLSLATGSVTGGDELILLVEKVSKKNIKVRFYELNEDEETVWEAYGKFRESDVHHQYAIVCTTPPYKNKDIENHVEVYIELVRPSDDERSDPPVQFRYKPRDVVISRKRRRTCSTANSSSNSSGSLSSVELPKTVQEQTANMTIGENMVQNQPLPSYTSSGFGCANPQTISQEYGRDSVLDNLIGGFCLKNSEELIKMVPSALDILELPDYDQCLETDGTVSVCQMDTDSLPSRKHTGAQPLALLYNNSKQKTITDIFKLFEKTRHCAVDSKDWLDASGRVKNLYEKFAEQNPVGDSLIHEIIVRDLRQEGIKLYTILNFFRLNNLLNNVLNEQYQSALHCACLHNRAHYIRPLLGLGCNPSLQDKKGNTALHIAVRDQHGQCVDSFMNMNGRPQLDLTLKNDEGLTPLHIAVRHNNCDVVKKFLEHDMSAALIGNVKDGNNALHMAVLQQNLALIKVILTGQLVGNMLTAHNTAGHTAIDLAKSLLKNKGQNDVWSFLSALVKKSDIKLPIKEEETSSSTDDDEESNGSSVETPRNITIKHEQEDMETDVNLVDDKQKLQQILGDPKKFQNYVEILEVTNKWKLLAEHLEVDYLLNLWDNASGMLKYFAEYAEDINIGWRAFSNALDKLNE